MHLVWSITDSENDARTVEEISRMSTLGKYSKKQFNCSHKPMFDFIPIDHVIIDTLHLFLRCANRSIKSRHIDIKMEQAKTNHILLSTNSS